MVSYNYTKHIVIYNDALCIRFVPTVNYTVKFIYFDLSHQTIMMIAFHWLQICRGTC